MNNVIQKTFQYGCHHVTIETGRIAKQASSVLITMGETVVLVTVVAKNKPKDDIDFFPLTVHHQEPSYAAGRIPGSYFRREGRPNERTTLISRLVDRALRPLFPKGFRHEVQIIATVLSYDPEVSTDIPAILGASAALSISGIPFLAPIGAARVGYQDSQYLLNPSDKALHDSELNLVVAGTQSAVLMVESEALELSEDTMLDAVMFGHQAMQTGILAIEEFAKEVNTTMWDWQPPLMNDTLAHQIKAAYEKPLSAAYQIHQKQERQQRIEEMLGQALAEYVNETSAIQENEVKQLFHDLEKTIVRSRILDGELRIDGRDHKTVRPLAIEVGVLPRAHGSALFTRGETQALVVTTLGTERDAQMMDELPGNRREPFMLHYNFPPYCVGETGMMVGPKRREIGHGMLACRAIIGILPNMQDYPYSIRVVSEITESNGSSSMATVCGASLALMDAGVEIKAPAAGIAMGLVKENERFAVLTDILGDEDHLGDMDFKVAGTRDGVTALQMDIKIDGITQEIMKTALDQAKAGRLHILEQMNQVLPKPRHDFSRHAPRVTTIKINPRKIRELIGKGGSTIKKLTEETNTSIDISDEGVVKISSLNESDAKMAKERIEELTVEVELGAIYEGPVVKIAHFGAFVSILPGREGMLHISQICDERVENIHDKLKEGQTVQVKVIEIDRQNRVRLSMKDVPKELN